MSRPTEAMPAPGHEAFAIHPYLLSGLRSGSLAIFAAIRRASSLLPARGSRLLAAPWSDVAGRGPSSSGLRNIPDFFDTFPVSIQGVA